MRIILDTNVLIDAFQDDFSAQYQLIDAVIEGDVEALTTPAIERENKRILHRLIRQADYKERINEYLLAAQTVQPSPVDVVIDDHEDMKFLEAAVGGKADMIVTNDRHLLDVGKIGETDILTPHEAHIRVEESGNKSSSGWQDFARGIGIGLLILGAIVIPVHADELDDALDQIEESKAQVSDKEKEIEKINQEIKELKEKRNSTVAEADIIASKVAELKKNLEKAEVELSATKSSLQKVTGEQVETESNIEVITGDIEIKREYLRALVRQLHTAEQTSVVRIFFDTLSLSDVLAERAAYKNLQDRTVGILTDLREKEEDLHGKKEELIAKENELTQLEKVQAAQATEVTSQKEEQAAFLSAKKEEQLNYERKIKEAEEARKEVEQKVFKLQSSGVELSLDTATDMAKFASKVTGVDPALLMAILKVESNLGNNVGSGKFPDDMQPASRDAFIRLTAKLGIDPYDSAAAPISRRPASGRGWGGAMGPSQMMPATWEGIEPRIEQLSGTSPVSPYKLEHAFVATAIYVADRGAAAGQEREALAKYIAGPNWTYWVNSWYTDRIMAVKAEYVSQF